jgi:hypothetical protein
MENRALILDYITMSVLNKYNYLLFPSKVDWILKSSHSLRLFTLPSSFS